MDFRRTTRPASRRWNERAGSGAIFMVRGTACFWVRSQRGGCTMKKRVGGTPTLFFIPLILSGFSPLFFAPLCRTGKTRGDDSDPPRNGGGMRSRVAGMCTMPATPSSWGRYRRH